ncbi:hypothetical protein P7C73_g2070, partial [Tremellales sp. Uapishka_1]
MVTRYTSPAIEYLHSDPSNRDERFIPDLFRALEDILDTLQCLQWSIPVPSYRKLVLHVGQVRDMLEVLEKEMRRPRGVLPAPPDREWVVGEEGRPRLVLNEEVLVTLMEQGYTDPQLQVYFGVGRTTLWRRRKALGINKRITTNLDDLDLAVAIERVKHMGTRQEGEIGILAGLRALNIVVPRARLRAHLRQMFPGEISTRWSKNLKRRAYSVAFYNSLWHIDGHHKLIRWKIVIHGGIDGFSRLVVFLGASSNNLAETVTKLFWDGVQTHGCPSRVRADYGGENLGVKQLMEEHRGIGRGSFIQGTSTHNQRIERLWVDLQRWCTDSYRLIFDFLEEKGRLDVDHPVQMWCLHFCYIPMLNHSLVWFTQRWNKHKVRTEGGRTPEQIAFQGTHFSILSDPPFDPPFHESGCMEALSRGYDLRRNPMASPDALFDFPDPSLMDFSTYGTDNLGARANIPPQGEDPYVVVNPVLEAADVSVAEYLEDPDLLHHLEQVAGPAWPPEDDFGTERYYRVCVAVGGALRSRFPHLYDHA